MKRHEVRDAEQAVSYLVDCVLATVCSLKMKKSSGKSETARQIAIAQTGCDWIRKFNLGYQGTRVEEVAASEWSVEKYAERFHP